MSSRGRSRITDDEINELISKLQSLLPESRRRNIDRVSGLSIFVVVVIVLCILNFPSFDSSKTFNIITYFSQRSNYTLFFEKNKYKLIQTVLIISIIFCSYINFAMKIGIGFEATEGDMQLHKELAPRGGRPQRSPFWPNGDDGRQQPASGDHSESS